MREDYTWHLREICLFALPRCHLSRAELLQAHACVDGACAEYMHGGFCFAASEIYAQKKQGQISSEQVYRSICF